MMLKKTPVEGISLRLMRRVLVPVPALPLLSAMAGGDDSPLASADPFWGNGAVADLEPEGMARGWSWEKAQTGNTHPVVLRLQK